jgi:hypothetical protein
MNMIELSVSKNLFSGILSVGHPSFSVVSDKLSVVGIPPVSIPVPEKIQLLMYDLYVPSFLNVTWNIFLYRRNNAFICLYNKVFIVKK